MGTDATAVDWGHARRGLHTAVGRVTSLLRTVRDPNATALGQWTLAGVAQHLSHAWMAVPGLARGDLSRVHEVVPHSAGRAGESLITELAELATLTTEAVEADQERDPARLADRIETAAAEYFAECDGLSADDRRPWLVENTTVSRAALTCHLLNETLVHGWDIAHAEARPWPIERADAVAVIEGFLIPAVRQLEPRDLVDQATAAGMLATYEVHVRGGHRWHFLFDDGELHIEDPARRRVDCHVSADPAAMLLVIWGRQSQWAAIARGQLVAWGRKPWLGPQLRPMMRNP